MRTLNHIEKIVLSSIQNGHTDIQAIHLDTSLPLFLIHNTINHLGSEQLIKRSTNHLLPMIQSSHSQLWKTDKHEVFSLIDHAYHNKKSFHFKLARFKEDDLREYHHLNHRLSEFIKDCNKRNKIPSKDQRYLFWGQVSQSEIASQY